jgi:hypothetical protein
VPRVPGVTGSFTTICNSQSLGMNEKLQKKVSPPFEGGVVGMIDYLIYTVFSFPTGVVDSWISFYLY